MMPVAACPPPRDLKAYVFGELELEQADSLSDHLAICSTCESAVQQIEAASDPFFMGLRKPQTLGVANPELAELLHRAEGIVEHTIQVAKKPAIVMPKKLRDYHLKELLGEGGMGAVYKAVHAHLNKVVAIKILPPHDRQEPVARFYAEMQAIGRLSHPNLVSAFDAGESDGMHFLVMEYVDGLDLSTLVARRKRLSIPDACELARQAALGLQCVHEQGLVHRDIKPSNLMVTAEGQVKILDLGLALLQEAAASGHELTLAGQVMGTADYIAPEQIESAHHVDIRADLYSLGATLFKLLTGKAPFSGEKFQTAIQKIRAHSVEPAPSVKSVRADAPDGLAALLARLLEKDPAKRPADPAAVAKVLPPFAAGADLRKLVAEARKDALVGELPSPVALTSTDADKSEQVTLDRLREREVSASKRATPAAGGSGSRIRKWALALVPAAAFVLLAIWVVIRDKDGNEKAVVKVDEGGSVEVTHEQPNLSAPKGKQAKDTQSKPPEKTEVAKRETPAPKKETIRLDGGPLAKVDTSTQPTLPRTALVAAPAKLAGADWWTFETRAPRGVIYSVAFRPGSKENELAMAGEDGAIRIVKGDDGRLVRILLGHSGSINHLAWSPDGQVLASGGEDGVLRIWNVDEGELIESIAGSGAWISAIAWSSVGRQVAFAEGSEIKVANLFARTVSPALGGFSYGVLDLALSPDSGSLLSYGEDGALRHWSMDTGDMRVLGTPVKGAGGLVWSPDGKYVAVISESNRVAILDGGSGEEVKSIAVEAARELSWSPDNKQLAIAVQDKKIDLYETITWTVRDSIPFEMQTQGLSWSMDSKTLAACGHTSWLASAAICYDIAAREIKLNVKSHPGIHGGAFTMSPDGKKFLTSTPSGFRVRETATLKPLHSRPVDVQHPLAAWSPTGSGIALGSAYAPTELWNPETNEITTIPVRARAMSWSPDGKLLAIGDEEGKVKLFDSAKGELKHEVTGHAASVELLAWSDDGDFLASTSVDRSLRLWNSKDGTSTQVRSDVHFSAVSFSHDGRTLAIGEKGRITLWDVATGQRLDAFEHGAAPWRIVWLESDRKVAAWFANGESRTWDAATGAVAETRSIDWRYPLTLGDVTARRLPGACRLLDSSALEPRMTILELEDEQWLATSPAGDYVSTPRIERKLVVVTKSDGVQSTLSPEEFGKTFAWKNNPSTVRLLQE